MEIGVFRRVENGIHKPLVQTREEYHCRPSGINGLICFAMYQPNPLNPKPIFLGVLTILRFRYEMLFFALLLVADLLWGSSTLRNTIQPPWIKRNAHSAPEL